MCPGFPGAGMLECGHATGSAALRRSSYSIGVSMPRAEWRRRRLWKISRYSNKALASSRRGSPAVPVEQFGLDAAPEGLDHRVAAQGWRALGVVPCSVCYAARRWERPLDGWAWRVL